MFTGIVESLGTVVALKPVAGGYRLRVATTLAPELHPGDSVAVSGVCLTVTAADSGEVHADIGPETARVTTLGSLQRDDVVNLERPLGANARLGGHFVQGHVDSVGQVVEVRTEDEAHWITVTFPPRLARYFVHKGSVAVDGVSLTVAGLGEKQFDVQIIPFTWTHTALSAVKPGTRVNLECDMLGKYVLRALDLTGPAAARQPGEQ